MIIDRLEEETGVAADKIERIVLRASHLYKSYRIAKRTNGFRDIHHPSPDLKFLQRWLNRNIFPLLPIHNAAIAYRRGMSIVENGRVHARNKYLLKTDFKNFFPSLTRQDVKLVLNRHLKSVIAEFTAKDVEVILNIVCRYDALTIGAPSSPVLSNAILFNFDDFVSRSCEDKGVIYTRYADDLFFSTNTPNLLTDVLQLIRSDLRDRKSPHLALNQHKTVFTSKKRRRLITGLVLTSDGRLSVGRAKKRSIRTLIYLYSKGKLDPGQVSYLRGYLAFLYSIEPDFLARIRIKFGDNTVNDLMIEDLKTRKLLGAAKGK